MTAIRICFVGDSITAGTGDNTCLGWPGRISAAEIARGHDVSCTISAFAATPRP